MTYTLTRMIDFPANPTVGQVFQGWKWDGVKWISAPSSGGSGGASITVSDTPPPNPTQGALWWESVNGQMYVFYNDGSIRASGRRQPTRWAAATCRRRASSMARTPRRGRSAN